AERTPVLAVASAAASAVAALGRIANDVTFLSREEVGEVRLAGGGGSSAMPHKRNPVDAVAITAAAVESPGLLQVVASAALAGDERSAGRWHAEWSSSRRLARLARSAAGRAVRLVETLSFDRDRAAQILATSGAAGERPDREVLVAASDRIVDRALDRFAAVSEGGPRP
ncbi:lyase family protein, partial [Agromyces sp. Marseille-Q5079]|uniref:lyase family protein n=1 Tax=Agromyces sp. Marseille-Q5079 TaxID=3439059 RepID=UPI003D9C9ADF